MSSARVAAAAPVLGLVLGLVAAGCSPESEPRGPSAGAQTGSATQGRTASPDGSAEEQSARPVRPVRPVRPGDFRVGTAASTVAQLAGAIGPRHATSPAYDRAAAWVAGEFHSMGYDVRRQRVEVPAGVSWGVGVDAGTSVNVVATPPRFDPRHPHLVVGAHLDTVPQAPGAEDNASGVGVVLAAAEAVEGRRTRLPVVFIAFGAEEPRGPTDSDHHYGSRAYVASLDPAERRAVRGMLSLDRVGVGSVVPVSLAGPEGTLQRARVVVAARRAGVPAAAQLNRSSDHWQFVLGGMPGIRIGSTPYAEYHSAADLPRVVSRAQMERTGRVVLAWLQ